MSVFYELEDRPVLLPSLRTLATCTCLSALKQLWAKGDHPLQHEHEEEQLCTELVACASLGSGQAAALAATAGLAATGGCGGQAETAQAAQLSAKLRGMIRVVCTAGGSLADSTGLPALLQHNIAGCIQRASTPLPLTTPHHTHTLTTSTTT